MATSARGFACGERTEPQLIATLVIVFGYLG
jgi:hypothetical protein